MHGNLGIQKIGFNYHMLNVVFNIVLKHVNDHFFM